MNDNFGLIVEGDRDILQKSYDEFNDIPVDLELCENQKQNVYKSRKTIVESKGSASGVGKMAATGTGAGLLAGTGIIAAVGLLASAIPVWKNRSGF